MLQKRILLVDDEENIRNTYCCLLTEKGFSVVTSDSVKNARKGFLNNQFDLVITDLGMTEDNGFTLVKEIKEMSPNTPVILLTGSVKTEILSEYSSILGVYAMIEKRCSAKDFISCVMGSLGLKHE
ncbi:MAG: response regulator [Deltaproteobacteria bacterium]|jgi:DNA-binding NtrC family response regulator|nr:response regulator [Deltaproteobacteria bacterium]MBW2182810.1 response regulator [Deltaproteobacteria bacterium]